MLAVLYLILCFSTGAVLCTTFLPELSTLTEQTLRKTKLNISKYFILLPAWFATGTILITWITYFSAYAFQNKEKPLIFGNLISMSIAAAISIAGILVYFLRKRHTEEKKERVRLSNSEIAFIVLTVILVFSLMYGTFFVRNKTLYVGISVFSDFAPHLGMIRSFSLGNNFPTTYSHYAGEDIRYHFMFQFLVGNLEFLGLRLDHAFNIPSMLSLIFAYFLLYALALRISGRKSVGFISCLLFAFRCSPSFFSYLASLEKGTTLKTVLENTTFIGYTTNENWGLWNLNVYCNQRHLALGICVLLIIIHLFIGNLYEMAERWKAFAEERAAREEARRQAEEDARLAAELALAVEGAEEENEKDPEDPDDEPIIIPITHKKNWLDKIIEISEDFFAFSFFNKEGWLPKRILIPIAAGILLGAAAFWNGAAVLATIMVLFVFAMAADHRLEYLITAVIAAGLSMCQTKFFTEGESVVSTKFQYGFIAENKTLFGTFDYVMRLCGILIPVLLVAFVVVKGVRKWILVAFSAPFLFSFYVSLTIDVTVNHKYIMMSIMLMNIFAAILLAQLLDRKNGWIKALAVFILVLMTITGFYDYTTVLKRNNAQTGCLTYSMEDPMIEWISENTTSQDIFLSAHYALARPVLAGAMLYEGHAYYPYTAGYDTNARYAMTKKIFECTDRNTLLTLLKNNKINYIIIDNDTRSSGDFKLNESIFVNTFEAVYTEGEGNWKVTIYDVSKVIAE